jgi:phosphoadenosine phosphosulfate reductase
VKDLLGNVDEEGMYRMAINRPLDEKIQQAIMLIQSMERQALTLSDDGFYVCFSGGKDSIVMAKLFEMAGVKYHLHYNNVTIDPPELVQFIKRCYPETIWHSVGKPLPFAMSDSSNGPPTLFARWCCEQYKEYGGKEVFRCIGVRAEESKRRKGLWKQIAVDKYSGKPILCPVLYWTDADIWQFIRDNEMPYCCLYDEGFDRLGCIGCPQCREWLRRSFARWPKYEALWKQGFQRYWDKYKGTLTARNKERWIERFATVDDFWNWWISGKAYEGETVPDCQMWLW